MFSRREVRIQKTMMNAGIAFTQPRRRSPTTKRKSATDQRQLLMENLVIYNMIDVDHYRNLAVVNAGVKSKNPLSHSLKKWLIGKNLL